MFRNNFTLSGIHHITAIASDPEKNIDFYAGALGMRLVKRTVNFDDPASYHFYFGDETGQPGTILTFFTWPKAPRGRLGTGQIVQISLAVPLGSTDYWTRRFKQLEVAFQKSYSLAGTETLCFEDPDGLQLELVPDPSANQLPGWEDSPVSTRYAIRRICGVTMRVQKPERTVDLLSRSMGFLLVEHGDQLRFTIGSGNAEANLNLEIRPDEARGQVSVGCAHHIAWRTDDDQNQLAWQQELIAQGYHVTQVMDRLYFHSIYFREPGGILFEIATDPPGFTFDEPVEKLGQQLKLPPWLESNRANIERVLAATANTNRK
jgi:glyoxalase family protein